MWRTWRWTITSSCSLCPLNGGGPCSGLLASTASTLRRSRSFEPSACPGKSVVVTVDCTVTQRHVPVARLGSNARSVPAGLQWFVCPRVGAVVWEEPGRGQGLGGGGPPMAGHTQSDSPAPPTKETRQTGFFGHGDRHDHFSSVFRTSGDKQLSARRGTGVVSLTFSSCALSND